MIINDDDDDPEAFSRGVPVIPGSNQGVTWWRQPKLHDEESLQTWTKSSVV